MPTPPQVRDAVSRVIASRTFMGHDRLKKVLKLIVDVTLMKRKRKLSAKTICKELWPESCSLDTVNARTAVSHLRDRLEMYYSREGMLDPIEIFIPRQRATKGYTASWRVAHRTITNVSIAACPLESWDVPMDQCVAFKKNLLAHLRAKLPSNAILDYAPLNSASRTPYDSHEIQKNQDCTHVLRFLAIAHPPAVVLHAVLSGPKAEVTLVQTFNLKSESWFKEVGKIADIILVAIGASSISQPPDHPWPTDDPRPKGNDQYQIYARAMEQLLSRTAEGMRQAYDGFSRIIEKNSSHADGLAGLAVVGLLQGWYLGWDGLEFLKRAYVQARKARKASPGSLWTQTVHAYAIAHRGHRWKVAARILRKAIGAAEEPRPQAHHWLGNLLNMLGQHDEARIELAEAARLAPKTAVFVKGLGDAAFYAHDFATAIIKYDECLEAFPGYWMAGLFRGIALASTERFVEALMQFRKLSSGCLQHIVEAEEAFVLGRLDRREEAWRKIKFIAARKERGRSFSLAIAYMGLGDHDNAILHLEHALIDPCERLGWLAVDPHFTPLHQDARFGSLLRRLRLPGGHHAISAAAA